MTWTPAIHPSAQTLSAEPCAWLASSFVPVSLILKSALLQQSCACMSGLCCSPQQAPSLPCSLWCGARHHIWCVCFLQTSQAFRLPLHGLAAYVVASSWNAASAPPCAYCSTKLTHETREDGWLSTDMESGEGSNCCECQLCHSYRISDTKHIVVCLKVSSIRR